MRLVIGSLLFFIFVTVLSFQACSGAKFGSHEGSSQSATSDVEGLGANTGVVGQDAFGTVLQGIKGGHFDLDTSTLIYPLSSGKTNHHVHEYDDKYNVTFADYFNLLDPKFDQINKTIAPDTRFVLIISNAQLSPGGVLSLNGQAQGVLDYQRKVADFMAGNGSALPVFTLSGIAGQKLQDLKIGFPMNVLANGGLIGTDTSCVVKNNPGRLGEYRNGALIIQAVDADHFALDPVTKVATSGLLWESTIFWHWDGGCYN